jgi:hypothetical protein
MFQFLLLHSTKKETVAKTENRVAKGREPLKCNSA